MRRIVAQVVPINDKEYYIALKVARVCTFICYLPSCLYLICYAQTIDELAKEVCFCKLAIIPDDFNAWAIECSGKYTNRRSEALLRAFVNLDVRQLHDTQRYSYAKYVSEETMTDIAYASNSLLCHCHWQ